MAQIALEYDIHPVQLSKWKKIAIENIAYLFMDERKVIREQNSQEQKIERLYANPVNTLPAILQ